MSSVDPSAPPLSSVQRWFRHVQQISGGPASEIPNATAEDVARWLTGPARAIPSPGRLLHDMSWHLCAAGLPLARTTLHVGTLHPQFVGFFCRWTRAGATTHEADIERGIRQTEAYRTSPIRLVLEHGVTIRRKIGEHGTPLDFPILSELQAGGIMDYLATPLVFSDGQVTAATWATDRADGFTDREIAQIQTLLPVLAMLIEVRAARRIATSLLDVYLGRKAGQRVLRGDITRGSGETIRAVLLSFDLRGFTAMSDRLPGDRVIAILNAFFERLVAPIHDRGGEILKFIGDGMLAIFPLEDAAFAFNAARRALEAVEAAFAALDSFNTAQKEAADPMLLMAAALHVGDVIYGNIGGEDRLDFTAIGAAVNLLSRLQLLSKKLDRPLLLSDDFARICERPLVSLGFHPVRGLTQPQEVFALEDGVFPAK